MIIKGIGKKLDLYKTEKKIGFDVLKDLLGLSIRSIQKIIETDNVVKTETFIKLFTLLNLDIEKFLTENLMSINNNIGVQNGTINNVLNDNSRGELELIIIHQKKEIENLCNEILALKDGIVQRNTIIELLKK